MHYPPSDSPQISLHRFHGGLHLPDNKTQSTVRPLTRAALPERLILPLQQHIGVAAEPVVAVGDRVLKGQMIAAAQGLISAPVHASSSGMVTEIGDYPVAHPSGLPAPCITIETDGRDEWCELPAPIEDVDSMNPDRLRERIRNAGIVGLGGAAFPASVKLNPGPSRHVHTLVINGAECEPFITCDDMLMRLRAERVMVGVAILRQLLAADRCLIGIEDNKPEAIAAMQQALEQSGLDNAHVVSIPTLYPSGGEKQLIRILTGLEVPTGHIPAYIGVVCNNVGTAAAVADAVLEGRPLISRFLTLTGQGLAEPQNMEVLVGTPAAELIEQAGGYTDRVSRLILGGPMMGITLHDDRAPITKAANCLLAASAEEAPDPGPASACIRCGRCAEVCPASLLPQQMYWYSRARDLVKTQEYNLFDCIECGCCSHVCPAHIPLVQYFRFAKNESWAKDQEKRKAELARQRHEAKVARVERQEAERKALLKKKKEALAKKKTGAEKSGSDPKKAAIDAAVKRAAQKKAQLAEDGVKPANTEQLTAAQQRQVEQADRRRRETGRAHDGAAAAETNRQDG